MTREVTLYDQEKSIEHEITVSSASLPSNGDVIMDMGMEFQVRGHKRRYKKNSEGEYSFSHYLVGYYVE